VTPAGVVKRVASWTVSVASAKSIVKRRRSERRETDDPRQTTAETGLEIGQVDRERGSGDELDAAGSERVELADLGGLGEERTLHVRVDDLREVQRVGEVAIDDRRSGARIDEELARRSAVNRDGRHEEVVTADEWETPGTGRGRLRDDRRFGRQVAKRRRRRRGSNAASRERHEEECTAPPHGRDTCHSR